MTPAELAAFGEGRHGLEWQSALARELGMSPRHMRRLAAGDTPVTDGVAADLAALPALARWVLGQDEEGNERLVHLARPRFVCRVAEVGSSGLPIYPDEGADAVSGFVFSGEDFVLCEVEMIGDGTVSHDLMREAGRFVAARRP